MGFVPWRERWSSTPKRELAVGLVSCLLIAASSILGCATRGGDVDLNDARQIESYYSADSLPTTLPLRSDSQLPSESECEYWRARLDQRAVAAEGVELASASNGDMIALGRFNGSIDLDPGPGRDMATSLGGSAFIVSVDADGEYRWGRVIGPSSLEAFTDSAVIPGTVNVTPNGDVVVSGVFRGTIDLDPGAGTAERTAEAEGAQFIVRLGPDGDLRWDRMFHSPCTGAELEVTVTGDDAVYVAGSHEGSLVIDTSLDRVEIESQGGRDLFVIRLDEAGVIEWVRSIGGFGNVEPTTIAASSDGAVFVGGVFSTPVDFDPGGVQVVDGSGVDRRVPLGVQDAFVLSLDAHGLYRWTRCFGGVSSTVTIADLAAAPRGDVVVAGNFHGELRISQSQNPLPTTGGDENIFAVRLDERGEVEWTVVEERPGIPSVAVTTEEAVFIHGESHLLALNPDGTHLWQQFLTPENGTVVTDESPCAQAHIADIAQTADGGVALTGWFSGELEFDGAQGVTTMTSIGSQDALFLALDRNGDPVEIMTLGRPGRMNVHAVSVMADASVMVSGTFRGTVDFDPGVGIEERTAAGSSDFFISKIAPTGRPVWVRTIENSNVWTLDIGLSGNGSSVVSGEFERPPTLGTAWRGPRLPMENHETLYTVVGLAPNGNVRWGRDFASELCEPGFLPLGNVVEHDGTVTLVGTFWSGIEGPLDVEGTPLVALGEQDVAVVRLDPHGAVQWVSSVGTPGCQFLPTDLWITDNGTVMVTGTRIDDEEESLQHFGASLTPRGSLQWLRVFPAVDDDEPELLAGADGSMYFFGHISGTVDIDPGPEVELHSVEDYELIMIGLDADGERRHLQFLAADSDEGGSLSLLAATLGPDNGPLLLGEIQGPVDLDPGERLLEHRPIGGGRGLYYLRLNSDLTFNWAGMLDCIECSNTELDAFFTSPGGVIVTGLFDGAIDVDPTRSVDSRPANEEIDRFVVGLQTNGDVRWASTYPALDDTFGDVERLRISVATDGSIVVSGFESLPIDEEELTDDSDCSNTDIESQHLVTRIDPTGTELWTVHFSAEPETLEVVGLVATTEATFMTVRYEGELGFDIGGSNERRIASGETGLLLLSIANNGSLRWIMTSSLNDDSGLCSTVERPTPLVNGPPGQLPQWHLSERSLYDELPVMRFTCDSPLPAEIVGNDLNVDEVDDFDDVDETEFEQVKVHTVRRVGDHRHQEQQGLSYHQLAKQATAPSAFDQVRSSTHEEGDPCEYCADVANRRVLRLTSVDIGRILTKDMSPDLGVVPESGRQTKVRAALVTTQGGSHSKVLNHGSVLRVVNEHIQTIVACYETTLMAHPNSQRMVGRVEFKWIVNEEGGTEEVEVNSSTLQAPAVESCIASVIQGMEFPEPTDGPVMITFPFNFGGNGVVR